MIITVEDQRRLQKALADARDVRVPVLIARFNGLIKYLPMLTDHPEWTDDECIAFAQMWDAKAREQVKTMPERWNNGIPYCRNVLKGL